ncbi:hypothetical protein PT277_05105 [Acetobacteraceae bacterium ESL0709]|nr:hypothetical protein [Acetobacteraceae bacterium ESL0697]MDF7678073.1 hypothetical protein [Acetobacteraceae bacterium ESL0709]
MPSHPSGGDAGTSFRADDLSAGILSADTLSLITELRCLLRQNPVRLQLNDRDVAALIRALLALEEMLSAFRCYPDLVSPLASLRREVQLHRGGFALNHEQMLIMEHAFIELEAISQP